MLPKLEVLISEQRTNYFGYIQELILLFAKKAEYELFTYQAPLLHFLAENSLFDALIALCDELLLSSATWSWLVPEVFNGQLAGAVKQKLLAAIQTKLLSTQ